MSFTGVQVYQRAHTAHILRPNIGVKLPTDHRNQQEYNAMPTIALVDDDRNILTSVSIALESEGYRVQTYADGASALEGLKTNPPDLAVFDIKMPRMDGMELLRRLRQASELPVIFLTGHGDVPTAVSAVKRGAFDFVEKPFSNNTLVDRVEHALQASADTLAARRQVDAVQRLLGELTERERDVMRLVIEGRPNKLIADALGISVRTVEVHRARVFDKMGVKSAVELANLLRQA